MAIRFQCNACQAVKAVNARLLGREIKCPVCGAPVQLPTQQQIEEAQQSKQAEEKRRALQRAARPRLVEGVAVADELTPEERMTADERALAAAQSNFVRPKPPPSNEMDMTPMVDVTFLLLIFFMVTASFSVQKSIQRPPPRQEDPSLTAVPRELDENPDIVTVQVDEFNAYNVITTGWDRAVGSKQDLIVALHDAHQGDGVGSSPTKVIIQAHEDCIHAAVIAALDAGREAQFESFEVSTVEQFD